MHAGGIYQAELLWKVSHLQLSLGPSLKKCLFGIAYPGFYLVGRSVGIFSFFFKYLLFAHGRKW